MTHHRLLPILFLFLVAMTACDEGGNSTEGAPSEGQNPTCEETNSCPTTPECSSERPCQEATETCVEQKCVSKCKDVFCKRGTCQATTGQCVNKAGCTKENESTFCLEEHACIRGACTQLKKNCSSLTCERGVCTEDSTSCQNPQSCRSLSHCLEGFLCVEHVCVEKAKACRVPCVGNQECAYDEATLKAKCVVNPAGCEIGIDCPGGDVCVSSVCAAPAACSDDPYEPSHATSPIDLLQHPLLKPGNKLEGLTLCAEDHDVFTFNTKDFPFKKGTLEVVVNLVSGGGNGEVVVQITNDKGEELVSRPVSPEEQRTSKQIVLQYEIPADKVGVGESVIVDVHGVGLKGAIEYTLEAMVGPPKLLDGCRSARTLVSGATQNGKLTDTSPEAPNPSCLTAAEAPSEVWQFELTETSNVSIQVASTNLEYIVSVRKNCLDDASELSNSCVGQDTSGNATLQGVLEPGIYSVVVSAANPSASTGDYKITYSVAATCAANQTLGCSLDRSKLIACDTSKQVIEHTCSCDPSVGKCANPEGKTCLDPIPLIGGSSTISSAFHKDRLNSIDFPTGLVDACYFRYESKGNDTIYEVKLTAGQLFEVDFTSPSKYSYVYIQKECGSKTSCYGSQGYGKSHALSYYAEQEETIYLVVDNYYLTATEDWEFTWSVTEGKKCAPSQRVCHDQTTLRLCNSEGTGFEDKSCGTGSCRGGACQFSGGETCADAIDLGQGGTVFYKASEATADADPTCVKAGGAEQFFSVTPNAGDKIMVRGVSVENGYPSVYITNGCTDLDASCLVGKTVSNYGKENPIALEILAKSSSPYYIALDTQGASSNKDYFYDIQVVPPECTPGDPVKCLPDGTTLQYCNRDGFYDTYACQGSGVCQGNACEQPSGQSCLDPLVLNAGGKVSEQTSGTFEADGTLPKAVNSVDLNIPASGRINHCLFDEGAVTVGGDRVYALDLEEGDVFEATIKNANRRIALYIVDNCSSSPTCYASHIPHSTIYRIERYIQWEAPAKGRYYLVVDQYEDDGGSFTIDWSIDKTKICAPYATICTPSGDIRYCDATGSAEVTAACPNGCEDSFCSADPSSFNQCDATSSSIISASQTVVVDPKGGTSNVSSFLSCTGYSSWTSSPSGKEAFFHLHLEANQTVTVSLPQRDSYVDYLVSVHSSCTIENSTCLKGGVLKYPYNSAKELYKTFEYTAGSAPENIILMIDSTKSDSTYAVDLRIH